MRTIYEAVLEQLKETGFYKWIDWDKGQLKKTGKNNRPDVNYPCALIRIGITSTEDVTDTIQDCKANVAVTLAFNPDSCRTSGDAPEAARKAGLEPYNIIAKTYAKLQGFSTEDNDFAPLRRTGQSEVTHPTLFTYQIVFGTEFRDYTASGE